MKNIGVVDCISLLSSPLSLKQRILFFNEIRIFGLDFFLDSIRELSNGSKTSKDIKTNLTFNDAEWLVDKGILNEASIDTDGPNLFDDAEYASYLEGWAESHRKFDQYEASDFVEEAKGRFILPWQFPAHDDWPKTLDHVSTQIWLETAYYRTRAQCMDLQYGELANAIPLDHLLTDCNNKFSVKGYAIEASIKGIDIPDEETPWQDIIDFGVDSETKKQLSGFHRYISKLGREISNPVEIIQELEHLEREFNSHIRLSGMKTNYGTLESIVVVAAEVFENLATFNLSKAAKSIFFLKNHRIAMLEAEQSNPGKAISFLVNAKRRLTKPSSGHSR